jgi:hypothetical protein
MDSTGHEHRNWLLNSRSPFSSNDLRSAHRSCAAHPGGILSVTLREVFQYYWCSHPDEGTGRQICVLRLFVTRLHREPSKLWKALFMPLTSSQNWYCKFIPGLINSASPHKDVWEWTCSSTILNLDTRWWVVSWNRPWRPIWFWDVEDPTLYRESARRFFLIISLYYLQSV